ETDRNGAEARLREVSAQIATQENVLARTPRRKQVQTSTTPVEVVAKMQLDRNEIAKRLTELQGKYKDEHPAVVAAVEELRKADERLEEARNKPLTATSDIPNPDWENIATSLRELKKDRDGLTAKVSSLSAKVAGFNAQISQKSGVDVEHDLLAQQ